VLAFAACREGGDLFDDEVLEGLSERGVRLQEVNFGEEGES
jgi:hypothetical protein